MQWHRTNWITKFVCMGDSLQGRVHISEKKMVHARDAIRLIDQCGLHSGLVMSYGDKNLYQHWLK